jgi:hypothetical protein
VDIQKRSSGEDSDSDDQSLSPTPNYTINKRFINNPQSNEEQKDHGEVDAQQGSRQRGNIKDRLYCTHECLRGLAFGGPMDEKCPNAEHHASKHIDRDEFLRLVQEQLATDRGTDADCMPLYVSGARGSLFKVRLSSHGYTLVAKGVEPMDAHSLRHEEKMYEHLRDLQGSYIPVCLGLIDLIKPYYYDCGVYEHFMLLSYAGRPVLAELRKVDGRITDQILAALEQLHKYRVLHHDAEPRNVLYDKRSGKCMIVDLMLAESCAKEALGVTDVNSRGRKRNWGLQKQGKDAFAAEARSLLASLS